MQDLILRDRQQAYTYRHGPLPTMRCCPLLVPLPQEFEDARLEPDPEIINKLISTGRDILPTPLPCHLNSASLCHRSLKMQGWSPTLRSSTSSSSQAGMRCREWWRRFGSGATQSLRTRRSGSSRAGMGALRPCDEGECPCQFTLDMKISEWAAAVRLLLSSAGEGQLGSSMSSCQASPLLTHASLWSRTLTHSHHVQLPT